MAIDSIDESVTGVGSLETERDEMAEVRQLSQRQTSLIHRWRGVVLLSLLLTGVVVTFVSYGFLRREQLGDCTLAFQQFSKTLSEAALAQQRNVQGAMDELSAIHSNHAELSDEDNWPMVTLPNFELFARGARVKSGAEMVHLAAMVTQDEALEYLNYTAAHHEHWMNESHAINPVVANSFEPSGYKNFISGLDFKEDMARDVYYPVWTFSPPPINYNALNWNVQAVPDFTLLAEAMHTLRNETVFTRIRGFHAYDKEAHSKLHGGTISPELEHPHSFGWQPVYREAGNPESDIVATLSFVIAWDFALRELIPLGVIGIQVVVRNTCGDLFSYEVNGPEATFMGFVDIHDPTFDDEKVYLDLGLNTNPKYYSTEGHCIYSMVRDEVKTGYASTTLQDIYPSESFRRLYVGRMPEIFATLIAITFGLIVIAFYIYNNFVEKRNQQIISNAARSNAIITSLLPSHLRDKLIGENACLKKAKSQNLKSILADGANGDTDNDAGAKPLTDLFLETTVMFADISGFTAWSSVREPPQVFILLETLYSFFDSLAKRHRVFKVETVGDCYVAVSGVPRPQKDHAVLMCRFARDILRQMKTMTRKLEEQLGPETGRLNLRIGIHSGPVTGGILRGDRSRFQLFGDTMNTTSRLESTGITGKIQVSKTTADLLIRDGKDNWISKRDGAVNAKGKGMLETYWLKVYSTDCESTGQSESPTQSDDEFDETTSRLILWIVKSLGHMLTEIIANRIDDGSDGTQMTSSEIEQFRHRKGKSFLEDVAAVIAIGSANEKSPRQSSDSSLSPEVNVQLTTFVEKIASMYQNNAFHSFKHAAHVLMSVNKLMSRIVAPTDWEENAHEQTLHDFTYGITSSPLTQFACAFSALIHDVDHSGVTNAQLVKDNHRVAKLYDSRSPAEQNSLDLAWTLLLTDEFSALRTAIAPTARDLAHFRQLVLNVVLATDIADKGLKELRNNRWEVAFSKEDKTKEDIDRKATIVIEHLIQASDVSHTMQHWHIYRKWNEAFFEENWQAYLQGRADKDPAEYWYRGEIGFFDFYIIPLAKKLKECGVFGVSSDEFLNYALQNRHEWERRGQEVVNEMKENLERKYCVENDGPTSQLSI